MLLVILLHSTVRQPWRGNGALQAAMLAPSLTANVAPALKPEIVHCTAHSSSLVSALRIEFEMLFRLAHSWPLCHLHVAHRMVTFSAKRNYFMSLYLQRKYWTLCSHAQCKVRGFQSWSCQEIMVFLEISALKFFLILFYLLCLWKPFA